MNVSFASPKRFVIVVVLVSCIDHKFTGKFVSVSRFIGKFLSFKDVLENIV